jgi:ferredoxin-NADP reductase
VKRGLDIAQQTPTINYSPYNPPVRYLKSEAALHPLSRESNNIPVTLSHVTPITSNICAFTFSLPSDHPVTFIPGQHVLIDFSKAKPKQYSHMNEARPQRLNDDFVRSWTISSIPPVDPSGTHFGTTTALTCTIKLNEAGEITPFIYSYARFPPKERPTLNISHRGVNGTFTVFNPPPASTSPLTLVNKNLVFIAGGIGVTPFLSFHAAIQALHLDANITLLFSGRNDELLLAAPFFSSPSSNSPSKPLVNSIKLFQTGNTQDFIPPFPQVNTRRMEKTDVEEALGEKAGGEEKTVFLCGPVGFMDIVVMWLGQLGVDPERVKQEAFNF